MMIWLLLIAQLALPPEVRPLVLNATVHVKQDKGKWTYTVCNNEPGVQIMMFQMEKIDVRQASATPPVGWKVSISPERKEIGFLGGIAFFPGSRADFIREGQCASFEIAVDPNIEKGK